MKENLVSKFNKLGLNEYEARTYLALIGNGQQTAKEISENSKVPYSRIYDVLRELREKKWVDEIETNPKKFQAKHESFTLSKAKEEIDNLIKSLDRGIKSFKEINYQKHEPEMLILSGWETISSVMLEEVSNTNENITTMVGFKSNFLDKFIDRVSYENVEFRLITRFDLDLENQLENNIEKNKLPFAPKIWVTWFDWTKIIGIFPTISENREIIEEEARGIYLEDKNLGKWANQVIKSMDVFK